MPFVFFNKREVMTMALRIIPNKLASIHHEAIEPIDVSSVLDEAHVAVTDTLKTSGDMSDLSISVEGEPIEEYKEDKPHRCIGIGEFYTDEYGRLVVRTGLTQYGLGRMKGADDHDHETMWA